MFARHLRILALVFALGVYKNLDWVSVAKTLDLRKMTHLALAFINPPLCTGPCTAQSDMTLGANRSFTDEALKAIVDKAHANGTKVLIALGGAGGDRRYMQFYNAGLSKEIVEAIDAYVKKHNLDGVDVDIEQPKQMGVPFTTFVETLVAKLRPQGKLVTAAVAQYIQAGTQDEVLPMFDIVNYQGHNSIARQTQLSLQYGGAMIWELTQDDPSHPHSLLKVIQKHLDPAVPPVPAPAAKK